MFSQVSVILFTWGCVHPSMHWARHPPPPCMPGYTSPLSSACWDTSPCPVHAGMHAPPPPGGHCSILVSFCSSKPAKEPSVIAWEQWMVVKAKQLRIEQERKALKIQKEKEEEELKQKEKVLFRVQ